MKPIFSIFLSSLLFLTPLSAATTHREKQLENKEVIVWKTTIAPHQTLPMHRHDHRRVVVALTDLDLTIKNNHGKSQQFVMKRGTARILAPNPPKEFHCDINNSDHPMEAMVMEFKK